MDYLQFHNLCRYWKFLQPQGAPRAEAGWKYDLYVPLGVSERDAQVEDIGFTQQQTHKCPHRGNTIPYQHYLFGSIKQQISHPAL